MTFNKPSMNGLNNFSIQEVNDDIANLETNKQNVLTAGTNITITGDEISATGGGTTYTAGNNISISESNVISATDTNTEYTAGTNVSISAGNVISATDTNDVYTAGTNVSISAGNVISATDTNTEYTAGTNVSISAGNVISATDTNTEYTAGTNVNISAGNVISATDTNDIYTAGTNVSIIGNVISATDTNTEYTAGTNVSIIGNVISATDTNTEYTAGTNVSINANVISATDTNTEYTAGTNVSIIGNEISSTNTEYTASSNGGLGLSGTGFSLDLNNLNDQLALSQDLVFTILKTNTSASATGSDFYIAPRNSIDSSNIKDELIISPSITDAETSEDGKLHLGGYIDAGRSTYLQTTKNYHYSGEHHFYLEHTEKYAFYNSHMNIINQYNDSSIDMGLLSGLETDGYTYFVKGIRMGWAGNPPTITGEGRGYYMGLLNKADGNSSNALMAFGKDGGGGGDPNIGVAISPSTGDIYYGGEIRGGGRRGGRNLLIVNYNQNDAKSDDTSIGNGVYGGTTTNGAKLGGISSSQKIGDSFYTIDATNGSVSVNITGTYKITFKASCENVSFNNRVVVGMYLCINDADDANSGFRNPDYSGRFGMCYLRDNNYGYAGNINFHTYIELDNTDVLTIKTKLGEATDDRLYNETEAEANINVFANMEIELICSDDIISAG